MEGDSEDFGGCGHTSSRTRRSLGTLAGLGFVRGQCQAWIGITTCLSQRWKRD